MGEARPAEFPFAVDGERSAHLIARFYAVTVSVQKEDAEDDANASILFSYPALFWSERWPELRAAVGTAAPEMAEALQRCLHALESISEDAEAQGTPWPFGTGPIEELAASVHSGELGMATAFGRAKDKELAWGLSPRYIESLAAKAEALASADQCKDAVVMSRLLLAAVDGYAIGHEATEMRRMATLAWLTVAKTACSTVPDGRIFRDAVARGEALISSGALPETADGIGRVLFRLGTLNLDPFEEENTSPLSFDRRRSSWHKRFEYTHGPIEAIDSLTTMPDKLTALKAAIGYFERAATYQDGEARGRTLKALAQALLRREEAGGEANRALMSSLAAEALRHLDPQRHPSHITVLRSILRFAKGGAQVQMHKQGQRLLPRSANSVVGCTRSLWNAVTLFRNGFSRPRAFWQKAHLMRLPWAHKGSSDEGGQGSLLWLDPDDVIHTLGEAAAFERYRLIAGTASSFAPDQAIALVLRVWPCLSNTRHEGLKIALCRSLSRALHNMKDVDRILGVMSDFASAQEHTVRTAELEAWPRGRLAGVLAGLAFRSIIGDQEDQGLPLIEEALRIAGETNGMLVEPLLVLRVQLATNHAANLVNVETPDRLTEAVECYCWCLAEFTALGFVEHALDSLDRLENVAFRGNGIALADFAETLAAVAPILVGKGPPCVGDRVRATWERLIARTVKLPTGWRTRDEADLIWLELQAAKGAGFTAMARRRRNYDWRSDPEATSLLTHIAELRRLAPPPTPENVNLVVDEFLLSAYTNSEPEIENEIQAALQGAEQRFDTYITRALTTYGNEGVDWAAIYPDAAQTASLLGPQTVLLSLFACRTPDELVLYTALHTDDKYMVIVTKKPLEFGLLGLDVGSRFLEIDELALFVAELRHQIVAEPGPASVGANAVNLLQYGERLLLGDETVKELTKLRARGKNHLCINPHGALHFYPFHLVGPEGRCLADVWTVTYLPHPTLLIRRAVTAKLSDKHPVTAFSLSFENGQPHGLPSLPNAHAEAETVARLLNGTSWKNQDATTNRFIGALHDSRRVHVATHGQHNVASPAFQCLFLHPDQESDGVFRAYEAFGLDLQHLELVTLSACETALGRFDIGDNLRGLPAALLIAGVSAVVSCLWPVPDEVSERFFGMFYSALAAGHDRLTAFRQAQDGTRVSFRGYRDWGAFHYSGTW